MSAGAGGVLQPGGCRRPIGPRRARYTAALETTDRHDGETAEAKSVWLKEKIAADGEVGFVSRGQRYTVTVHYIRNPATGALEDFEVKTSVAKK